PVPAHPKTTYNVGLIDGGVSINTIAPTASALVDMRSIDAGLLQQLVADVERIAHSRASNGIEVKIDLLGERPAGTCSIEHPIVQSAARALRRLGFEPVFDASSTDANAAIGVGIPAVCVGITHGGGGHTVSEY